MMLFAKVGPLLVITKICDYCGLINRELGAQLKLSYVLKQTCQKLLLMNRRKPFFGRMVTCDQQQVYYNNTRRKGGRSEPGQSASTSKVLLCNWSHCCRIICYKYLKSGQTIDGYSEEHDKRSPYFTKPICQTAYTSAITSYKLYQP